ncbi:inhibitor of growth protein 4-like isoform X2 [Panonychus citri]|uniref:inhibitor of growth protein 4-like isoform X2 n=1 Tax=Panonychus citri TaxID=50023 RepID=UPI002307B75B|nr:inhibitor of growth protein 4-like isoform X2 [Panonychus citri]
MAMSYLEQFLESLDALPADLQRNFTLMRDLDLRTQELIKRINNVSESYLNSVNDLNNREKGETFKEIRCKFEEARSLSDDKVQLAMQTYEMIDKHIRRLDSELLKLEAELKEKILFKSTGGSIENGKKRGRKEFAKGKNKTSALGKKNINKNDLEKGGGRKKQKFSEDPVTTLSVLGAETSLLASITGSTDVLDMPVDPNEPTYCICHQVSYGEMIGCDNPDCPIEWFHFTCVNLINKPKGKWFCPKCTSERKKR